MALANYPDSVNPGDLDAPWNAEDVEPEEAICTDCDSPAAIGLDECEACNRLINVGELSELALEIYAEEVA